MSLHEGVVSKRREELTGLLSTRLTDQSRANRLSGQTEERILRSLIAGRSSSDSRSGSGRSTSIGGADIAVRGVAGIIGIAIGLDRVERALSSTLPTSTEESVGTAMRRSANSSIA